MNTESKICDVKEQLKQLKTDYDNKVLEAISQLKGEYRTNSNRTQLVAIQNIDGDYLECCKITARGDDIIFSIVKMSVNDYLNDFKPDEEGLTIIKGVLSRMAKDLGLDIKELFEVSK